MVWSNAGMPSLIEEAVQRAERRRRFEREGTQLSSDHLVGFVEGYARNRKPLTRLSQWMRLQPWPERVTAYRKVLDCRGVSYDLSESLDELSSTSSSSTIGP